MNIFFTSDTHAFHKNICRGVTSWGPGNVSIRDFDDQFIMTNVMANRINDVVGADDILYHLGDWSFGGKDKIRMFRDMINCKNIHLIYGNHDTRIKQNFDNCQKLFSSVAYYRELYFGGLLFTLCHVPIGSWIDIGKGGVDLYGHCHGSYSRNIGRQMDVGVDTNDLYPYSLEEILDKMLNINPELVDHHDANSNTR